MGIWSYPLFVIPENLIIDVSKISEIVVENLNNHGYFSDFLEKKNKRKKHQQNLKEIHSECCSMARIWGYFNLDKVMIWYIFMKDIINQHKNLTNIEFHFFCENYNFPFCMKYDNENDWINILAGKCFNSEYFISDDNLLKNIETSDNLLNFKNLLKFDSEKYEKNYKELLEIYY